MLLVSSITLPFEEDEALALEKARKAARLTAPQIRDSYVYKRALDARRRDNLRYVYTVAFETQDDQALAARAHSPHVVCHEKAPLELPLPQGKPLGARPVIAGFGPAGMFCALLLARGGYRPIVLERGAAMPQRVQAVERFWSGGAFDAQSNVQFGEGGAGTFSDGKLTTRIHDPLCEWVLDELVGFGAPGIIARRQKPHIGTDRLRDVVVALRQELTALGGEVCFSTPVTGLRLNSAGAVCGVDTPSGSVAAGVLVAALGHSARDSFRMLLGAGVDMAAKAFSVGVRIEHRREDVERALFGAFAGHPRLPAAEYQLSWRQGERGVYTFCMCPGGVVVPASSASGGVVVNGMSCFARDGDNSNSALVCSVAPGDFGPSPLDGTVYQERLERAAFELGGGGYSAPAQTAGLFLQGKPGIALSRVQPSYARGVTASDLGALFGEPVSALLREGLVRFGQRQKGFDAPDSVLTGVESRTSSPVRILRGEELQSSVAGLYPCGEGAGWAGGIMSAAVDGARVALRIMRQVAPAR